MKIDSENYVEHAMRTDCNYDAKMAERVIGCLELLHAAMGMVTEAGELIDMLKKHIFAGKPLDLINAEEETGDSFWYNAKAINAISKLSAKSITMNSLLEKNINKLKIRYPQKFNTEDCLNRNLEAERELLEKNFVEELNRQLDLSNKPFIAGATLNTNSLKGKEWIDFASEVLSHIDNYTVPQYGDKGKDQASEWTVEHCIEESKKYINRYGRNARMGQEELDFKKAAHYMQIAYTKHVERNK